MNKLKRLQQLILDEQNNTRKAIRVEREKIHASHRQIADLNRQLPLTVGQLHQSEIHTFQTELNSNNHVAARISADHRFWLQSSQLLSAESTGSNANILPFLTIGRLSDAIGSFSVPLLAPFIGSNRTIVFPTRNRRLGHQMLEEIILQFIHILPDKARLTLLDPYEQGKAFPLAKDLQPWARPQNGNLSNTLKSISEEISRTIAEHLGPSIPSFECLPSDLHEFEPFELIVIANFPRDFENQDIRNLLRICRNGPSAGKYVIIHQDGSASDPLVHHGTDFENLHYVDLDQKVDTSSRLQHHFATPLNTIQARKLLNRAQQKKIRPSSVPYGKAVSIPTRSWWEHSSIHRIETPIGFSGARDPLNLYFGEAEDRRPCAHGILGAMTGSGKSNLYHVLICGLAQRYSPDEIEFYLVDGKDGVEFQEYQKLPHARAVVLHASPEASKSVITALLNEKERRNGLFAHSGVVNFVEYRRINGTKLPRLLLLVDEFQELFKDDKDGSVSKQILLLSQQGRSAGIHFLLGSQKFGAEGMLHQASTFGNTHLRIAMAMAESSIAGLCEFGKTGKRLVTSCCDMPGKVVVNDRCGDDTGNKTGRVAYLPPNLRCQLIEQIAAKAFAPCKTTRRPIVLNGQEQPEFCKTPAIQRILTQRTRSSDSQWSKQSKESIEDGGFALESFSVCEHPHIYWIGRENNLTGHPRIITKREAQENILLLGGQGEAHYGMLCSILLSLAMEPSPKQLKIFVIDKCISDTSWHQCLRRIGFEIFQQAAIPYKFSRSGESGEKIIDSVATELGKRQKLSDQELSSRPSIILMIASADRLTLLNQTPDRMRGQTDSELGAKLRTLYTQGPPFGIQVILSFGLASGMKRVLDRAALTQFRHRILLQTSEDDSLALIQNRQAALLQAEGQKPIYAIYKDMINDTQIKLKPFSLETADSFHAQLKEIGKRMNEWRTS